MKHIFPGAVALSGTAGYVNSVVLGFFDTPVSHMSGAVSRFGLNIAKMDLHGSLGSLGIVLGFLCGAMLAGVFVGATKLVPSRRFGAVMVIEGLLLLGATWLLMHSSAWGPLLAATACGLQNAMSSSYCGLMIRTTHVSGVVTDMGVMLGHWLRHRRIVTWKLHFLVALLLAFGSGGILGACLDIAYGPLCLLMPAVGCTLAGAVFFAVMQSQPFTGDEIPTVPRTSIFPND